MESIYSEFLIGNNISVNFYWHRELSLTRTTSVTDGSNGSNFIQFFSKDLIQKLTLFWHLKG